MMVRDFQSVIGREARRPDPPKRGKAAGLFGRLCWRRQQLDGAFLSVRARSQPVKMLGVEAAGRGLSPRASMRHRSRAGRSGVLHGSKSYVLQNELRTDHRDPFRIAAGLDYPGVGPELSYLRDSGRAEFDSATDQEAIAAIKLLAEVEGIIPALEAPMRSPP